MRRTWLRAAIGLLPLLATLANGARAAHVAGAGSAAVCAVPGDSVSSHPGPSHPPFLAAATPTADVAPREAGPHGTPVHRCARSGDHQRPRIVPADARARAVRAAWLDFRECLARAWTGSFFGSTAPPPSLS